VLVVQVWMGRFGIWYVLLDGGSDINIILNRLK
jgi:hypothetical protein